jgi:hypothetical protein
MYIWASLLVLWTKNEEDFNMSLLYIKKGRRMKKLVVLAGIMLAFGVLHADQPAPSNPGQTMDCAGMSDDMKNFAMTLNAANKSMFCNKFNDAMRSNAMMMSAQKDTTGNMTMTPDQAVEKVAMDNNMSMQKSAGGCPVK